MIANVPNIRYEGNYYTVEINNMHSPQVVLYSRSGCCLCDDALELLRQEGLQPQVIDIDQHPELREKFTSCVPVVEIDGKVRFRGRVNAVLLRRLLHASSS
jgi:glutaredoxin